MDQEDSSPLQRQLTQSLLSELKPNLIQLQPEQLYQSCPDLHIKKELNQEYQPETDTKKKVVQLGINYLRKHQNQIFFKKLESEDQQQSLIIEKNNPIKSLKQQLEDIKLQSRLQQDEILRLQKELEQLSKQEKQKINQMQEQLDNQSWRIRELEQQKHQIKDIIAIFPEIDINNLITHLKQLKEKDKYYNSDKILKDMRDELQELKRMRRELQDDPKKINELNLQIVYLKQQKIDLVISFQNKEKELLKANQEKNNQIQELKDLLAHYQTKKNVNSSKQFYKDCLTRSKQLYENNQNLLKQLNSKVKTSNVSPSHTSHMMNSKQSAHSLYRLSDFYKRSKLITQS